MIEKGEVFELVEDFTDGQYKYGIRQWQSTWRQRM